MHVLATCRVHHVAGLSSGPQDTRHALRRGSCRYGGFDCWLMVCVRTSAATAICSAYWHRQMLMRCKACLLPCSPTPNAGIAQMRTQSILRASSTQTWWQMPAGGESALFSVTHLSYCLVFLRSCTRCARAPGLVAAPAGLCGQRLYGWITHCQFLPLQHAARIQLCQRHICGQ